MDVLEALLDSWDRQCRIVDKVAEKIDDTNKHLKPSEDGMPLDQQLAHMFSTRRYFLKNVDPERGAALGAELTEGWTKPVTELDQIKALLKESGPAVRESVKEALTNGVGQFGWYDNPVLYIQHLIWHEGWHVGLIFLGLRLGGQEPAEEWEETNVWGEWRTEVWEG
jgi:uncharacterized damage-inducible protein DinB